MPCGQTQAPSAATARRAPATDVAGSDLGQQSRAARPAGRTAPASQAVERASVSRYADAPARSVTARPVSQASTASLQSRSQRVRAQDSGASSRSQWMRGTMSLAVMTLPAASNWRSWDTRVGEGRGLGCRALVEPTEHRPDRLAICVYRLEAEHLGREHDARDGRSASTPASRRRSRVAAAMAVRMWSGSCSTQPGRGVDRP